MKCCTYIFFFSLQPKKILLEHVSMHMIKRKCRDMEDREWEAIKQSEDTGMKEILGLEDYGQKMTDITKEYLNTIWIKRKLNKKGQKNRAENQNTENLGTTITIKLKGQSVIYFSSSTILRFLAFY